MACSPLVPMKLYNINANLIKVIESLYSKATSAVYYNGSVGEWFRTTAGVRQGCLLSPTLFNIFLERIMTDALENHEGLEAEQLLSYALLMTLMPVQGKKTSFSS